MIIKFLPLLKRLEDGVFLGSWLLKNNILKYFRWSIFVLSEKRLVMKRVVLNIVLLKNDFRVVILKMQKKVQCNEKQSTMK